MSSILKSTRNTRAILKGSLKYIRSDIPRDLTEEELDWLAEHNVLTVIDLRNERERRQKPCNIEQDDRFHYRNIPINIGDGAMQDVVSSYIQITETYMDELLDIVENAASNVLYFCSSGKDRTGVLSALLLDRLGYSRDYIVEDYMESYDNLIGDLRYYMEKHPEINEENVTPQKRFMLAYLDWLEQKKRERTACNSK